MIVGLVLAAGAGTRFGATKQLAELDGRALLQHAVDAANAAAGLDRVVVVLGHEADCVRAAIDPGRAEVVVATDWAEGQSGSLRVGLAAAGDAVDAIVVLLGDQPYVTQQAIERVLAARGDAPAVRATYDGAPGHPVVLERSLFAELGALRGDTGARNVLCHCRVTEVEMGSGGDDVDTPEQLEAVRR